MKLEVRINPGARATSFVGAIVAAATLFCADPAQARDLRLLSSWDSSYSAVENVLVPFVDTLEEAISEDIGINVMGPETIPPFEQFDPVSRGLFDMLFTNGAYHFNDTAAGMVIDAFQGGVEPLRSSGLWDEIDRHYQQIGIKLIAALIDSNGFHIMLREAVDDSGLNGRRIRGTPIHHPAIEALGGAPVVLPGGEIYPALERGVVDGAAWPTVGAVAYRWYEVADYMTRPTFGQVTHLVLMNLDTWNGLDDQTREEIETAARGFEIEAQAIFDAVATQERETLEAEGMEVTQLNDELAQTLRTAWFTGAMDLAATRDADMAEALRAQAIEAGLGE